MPILILDTVCSAGSIEAVTGMAMNNTCRPACWLRRASGTCALAKPLLADADPAEWITKTRCAALWPTVMGTNGPAMVPIQYWRLELDHDGRPWRLARHRRRSGCGSPPRLTCRTNSPLLPLSWIDTMWSQPPGLAAAPRVIMAPAGSCGLWVATLTMPGNDGSLDGTFSYTVRRADGYCWAVISTGAPSFLHARLLQRGQRSQQCDQLDCKLAQL